MQEKLEEVVEETTQTTQQDPGDENVVVDESKFESAGDDDVIKVDLSKHQLRKKKLLKIKLQPMKW